MSVWSFSFFLPLVLVGGTCEWRMCALGRHLWMHHVSYKWVMSHMNETCLIWMGRVSYEWVMSHMNEACLILTMNEVCPKWMRHVWYDFVNHPQINHWPWRKWVSWMSHIPYESVMSHMNESCPTWMRPVSYWPSRKWVSWMSHVHLLNEMHSRCC